MKKTVLFVILDRFSDWESAYASTWIRALSGEEYSVKMVAPTKEAVRSLGELTVIPDYDIASVPGEYEGLILVGGLSWRTEEAKRVKPLVEDALNRGKVLGAICDASAFLGKIGVLNHVKHTSNDLNDVKQWAAEMYTGEANYIRKPAVRDGNIITANGTASMEFAREVVLALGIASEDRVQEFYNFYKLGFYEAPMPAM